MNTLQALEFDRIRADLAEFCVSREGREDMLSLEPRTDPEEIARTNAEVDAVLRALEADLAPPGGFVPPLETIFSALRHRGEVLDLEALGALRAFLEGAGEFYRFFRSGEERELLPGTRSTMLKPPREPTASLRRLITGEGRLNEDAVPQIVTLRRRITEVHQELQHTSEQIIRADRDLYREDRATVRDGRTVLPLVADFKGRLDGIVHEASGSGETLFVEPRELVDLNNRLARTRNEILREIRQVLQDLTESARLHREELEELRRELTLADGLLARARYGRDRQGRIVPSGERIVLLNARHPLLGRACVPLDIAFEPGIRLMVLSGPNTGGKTVLLKTLGLLAVMNQCSVPLPVAEGSSLPCFRWIGVDIGDEQSIDEALSTFSAHLRTLGEITRRADAESLVLLDELGTGTDPEEGAALSLAIIDHLMDRGAAVLVTTHQTVLKHYGYTRDAASNAAMAFDEEEHRPTYRVIPGKPGVSHALETALEQGLAPEIVARARAYHGDNRSSVATIITRLLEEEELLQERMRAVQAREASLLEERDRLRETGRRLEERERELKEEGLRELKQTLRQARSRLEQEIRTLRERGVALDREEMQLAREPLDELEQIRQTIGRDVARSEHSAPPADLAPGREVRHRLTGQSGRVRSLRRDRVEVQFGDLRMSVAPKDLLAGPSEGDKAQSRPSRTEPKSFTYTGDASGTGTSGGPAPSMEIDLRGLRLEQALEEVERQVDAAIVHNLFTFSVIHGTGTGVLQKGIQDYLRTRREVQGFHFARPEEGGYGKTVVELAKDSGVG